MLSRPSDNRAWRVQADPHLVCLSLLRTVDCHRHSFTLDTEKW